MLRLHASLLAGLLGTLLLGVMGLLFVAAPVSGAVVYGPFMYPLPFGMVRRDRATRLRWLDLYDLLGIVTLVWVLVVGLTGVPREAVTDVPGLGTEVAETPRTAEPDLEGGSIAFPGTLFAGRHRSCAGDTPLTERLVKPVLIHAQTGTLTAARALPWYVTELLVSQPLHFGGSGGLPLKIPWAALNVVTVLVLVSNLYLWGKRCKTWVEDRAHAVAVDTPAIAAKWGDPA